MDYNSNSDLPFIFENNDVSGPAYQRFSCGRIFCYTIDTFSFFIFIFISHFLTSTCSYLGLSFFLDTENISENVKFLEDSILVWLKIKKK